MTELSRGVVDVVLAFADDEHLMGQHYTEWIGVTPFLEEDLAFSSIGQDELGHAALLYELLAGDDDLAIDELAFRRDATEYRSCWFVELPIDDWAGALVRHWLYDHAEQLRWQLLVDSLIPELSQIAARAEREESFHRRHANSLLDVLLHDDLSSGPLLDAAARLAPLALGLFDPVAGEAEAIASGVVKGPFADQRQRWQAATEERFGPIEWGEAPEQNGRTIRSAEFGPLMARMREVLDLDPAAVW